MFATSHHRVMTFCLPMFLFILFTSAPCPGSAQAPSSVGLESKNVHILHALESNVPINERIDQGLRMALEAGGVGSRKQFFEYPDLGRNPGPRTEKIASRADAPALRPAQDRCDHQLES